MTRDWRLLNISTISPRSPSNESPTCAVPHPNLGCPFRVGTARIRVSSVADSSQAAMLDLHRAA